MDTNSASISDNSALFGDSEGRVQPDQGQVSVISTSGLSKTFGTIEALKDLDLSVPQHSIVGFLGPNGAGKTTAIKLLLGLSRPTSGKARIFGMDAVAAAQPSAPASAISPRSRGSTPT